MAASIKRDAVKRSWEETEFPLVCETCLGDNPYVRMTREDHGKRCQVCETPFTVFCWQAGTKGRLKRVEICKSCAQAQNVCQVCVYDLQYGLPVQVRNQVLKEAGDASATTSVPQSHANRSWFTAQQQRALEAGETVASKINPVAHAELLEMAQMEPRYERNLPKLCSFYAKGECNRGDACPFRHELPKHEKDSPMKKQSTRNRFFGDGGDVVASKLMSRKRKQQEEAEQEGLSRSTVYVRIDETFDGFTENAIRDIFYACGEIASVRVQPEQGQAFVEYTTSQASELALAKHQTMLAGRRLTVRRAREPKRGDTATDSKNQSQGGVGQVKVAPVAPPKSSSSKKHKPLPKGLVAVRPRLNLAPPTNKPGEKYASTNPQRLGTS